MSILSPEMFATGNMPLITGKDKKRPLGVRTTML